MVTFDATEAGTAPAVWDAMPRWQSLPPLELEAISRLTVVAAHPDDETLGAGGLLSECAQRGIPTRVVVVTDGAASHQGSAVQPDEVAAIRQRELFLAVAELSADSEVVMLGFADGQTDVFRPDIASALARAIEPGSTVVAPWRGDGHRDHRVVAEICAEVAARYESVLLEYPIWMWHWAGPDDDRVPWESAIVLSLGHSAQNAKRRALARHASQVAGLGSGPGEGPVISAEFAANFDRNRELFMANTSAPPSGPKSQQYFDGLYAANPDPWRLGTRWYEERKREVTVASLTRPRFRSGLEIGCSTGELTAALAERCDALLAIDISAGAVSSATRRVAGIENVEVKQADATVEFPVGDFDLIVLSEVAYYWDRSTLLKVLAEAQGRLAPGGTILACHWRHEVADYPLGGDEVHATIRDTLGLHRSVHHEEADFRLELFESDASSVAQREGLVP